MKSLICLACVFVAAADPDAKSPTIKLMDEAGTAVDVVGVPAKELDALKGEKRTAEQWAALFAVYVDRGEGADRKDQSPLLGTYRVEKDVLRFEPRFPLAKGQRYRAVFDAARLPGHEGSKDRPLEAALFIPKPKLPPTVVTQIYPSRDDLPENQLKFYLHFSAPMSRGEAYANVKLLDDKGKQVQGAFLELDQELWDPEMKRFTLYIEPGRIKQGLKPREDLGPVLEKGKTYTLVVDRKWTDGNDEPLKETFKKTFRVVDADEKQPDPNKWALTAPAAQTADPLKVALGKSLEHALLHDCVWVEDDQGKRVAGTVEVADKETAWRFKPKEAWKAGKYNLVVDKRLEDLAGNSVAKPFEVDVFKQVEREIKTETVKVPFAVK
jgi:hypothetical protein